MLSVRPPLSQPPCAGWQCAEWSLRAGRSQRTGAAPLIGPAQSGREGGNSRRQRQGQGALQVLAAVKRKSDKHIVCSKQVIASPGTEVEVELLCKGILEFSRARMSERDSGIISFDVSKDSYDPNVFHFWECYESNSQMGKHNTSEEMTQFLEAVVGLTQEPVGMALYEMKDGQISNVCVQGGPKGEGGLDDASGGNGGAGGASMKQSSAVVDLGKQDRGDGDTAWGMSLKFPWQKDD